MKRLLILAFIVFGVTSMQAQDNQMIVNLQPPRPKVGVVLGGGGAKGAAHIGVLKYLEEVGIPVDYVAGTSMGSIIGGLYAMGYSPDEMAALIADMNWGEYIGNKIDRTMMSEESRERNSTLLLNVPFSLESIKEGNTNIINQLPSAYVNNSSLINLFNNLCVGYQESMDFNDLPIPFACVATDLVTGDEVVLRNGVVSTAMRASMAIPGVFAPVVIGDRVLVDGGLVNNFPADVLREMGADIIIGVEVTSTKNPNPESLQSLPQVMSRLLTNSTSAKRKENRELCNIHIIPDISGYGMLSFNPEAIDTLVERGYRKAQEYREPLLQVKQAIEQAEGGQVNKTLRASKAKNFDTDSVCISTITINNVTDRQSRWLIRKGQLNVGENYTSDDIEHAIKIYRGTGCFDDITYNVKEMDSLHTGDQLSNAYNLTIQMKPASPHLFGVGMRYDTEEGAALLLHLGLNEKRFGGSKLNLAAKLSYSPKIDLVYTYARPSLANFNVAYRFSNQHFKIGVDNDLLNIHYYQQKLSAYVSQFHLLNLQTKVGACLTMTSFDRISISQSDYDTITAYNWQYGPFLQFEYDNLDDAYFAHHGIHAEINAQASFDSKNHERNCQRIGFAFQTYLTPHEGRVTIVPQAYGHFLFGEPFYVNQWNCFGGEIEGRHLDQQLPFIGINHVDLGSDLLAILRCDVRYNFYGKHYVTAMYNMLYEKDPDYTAFHSGIGLRYAYNSVLGPIALTAQWSDITRRFSAYFSVGYTF